MQAILVLTNLTPLCFRTSRSDSAVETLHYIPGTALLGGLATAFHRMKYGRDRFQELFNQFFISGKIRFGNLYPTTAHSDHREYHEISNDHEVPVRPIPKTARSCKRFPGFRFHNAIENDEEHHGIMDSLISWGLFTLSGQTSPTVFASIEKCPNSNCKNKTSDFGGFYRHKPNSSLACAFKPKSRLVTRTGMSRKRGTVMPKILYQREILSEHQQFWGRLEVVDDTLWDEFEAFLEQAFHREAVYLGNNKTRGLGKVGKAELITLSTSMDTWEDLRKRVLTFTNQFKEKASRYQIATSHTLYIPITLQSDVILQDGFMRYHSAIDSDYLEAQWGLHSIERIYQCSSIQRVMGWNAFAGLPKADEIAISMGSVFLFGYTGTPDDHFWQTLLDIQTNGIGERRHEGFGRIMIAEPFHSEVNTL